MTAAFPSWRYGPNGEAVICNSADDVPAGFVDHPRKVKGGDPSTAGEDLSDPHNVPTCSEAALVEAAKKFDRDGDGKPGGSKPRKKAVGRDDRK